MASTHFVRGASPEQQVQFDFVALFRGIALDAGREASVREILARCVESRNALPREIVEDRSSPAGDGVIIQGAWDRIAGLHAERDAALRDLLASDAERAAFDGNAEDMRRRFDAARPPGA